MNRLLAMLATVLTVAACGGDPANGADRSPEAGDEAAVDVVAVDALADPEPFEPGVETAEPAPDAAETAADAEVAQGEDAMEPAETPSETTDPGADVEDWSKNFGTRCELAKRVGRFEVTESYFPPPQDLKVASVGGSVSNAVPALQILKKVGEEGACRLLQRVAGFCDPACAKDQECTQDGVCVPYPIPGSVGKVEVTGLAPEGVPVGILPATGMKYSFTSFPGDGDNAFEPGAHIELVAAGADLGGFALQGMGVPDLVMPDKTLKIVAGQALAIEWTAEPGPWKIYFSINVDQHGLTPVTLVCEVDDTGTYAVPSTMMDALLGFNVSGFATTEFGRRTVDSTEASEGCVELVVMSSRKVRVCADVTGAQCPD